MSSISRFIFNPRIKFKSAFKKCMFTTFLYPLPNFYLQRKSSTNAASKSTSR